MLAEARPLELVGSPTPRLAPPRPLRHDLAGYRESAASIGITPMPWQDTAACYLTAIGPDDLLLYREVAVVVARQNGKTTLTKPLIVRRLKAGRHLLHIAQVRELPRIMFEEIADAIEETDPGLFPKRRGKIIWPRRGAGSESIKLTNGGSYRISAAGTGSARGQQEVDDLLIDELREIESFDVVNAAKPAQRFSKDPQTVYLSNAGTDDSVVLNSLRTRSEAGDASLAYLEWSADPDLDPGDESGWLQANPAISPDNPQVLRDLRSDYLAAKLSGNLAGFETEALCRWVKTMRPALVSGEEWAACRADGPLPVARRTHLAVSMDPDGARASAVTAWLGADDICYLSVLDDRAGSPVRTSVIGKEWRDAARSVPKVGYDPMTDAELAKFFKATKAISGMEFANATANFVARVKAGRLRWADAESVGTDLEWTARKENDETGSYAAVRANDDRPITASLAAIRAVWLATGLRPARPRIR